MTNPEPQVGDIWRFHDAFSRVPEYYLVHETENVDVGNDEYVRFNKKVRLTRINCLEADRFIYNTWDWSSNMTEPRDNMTWRFIS